jgi:hypothetical protein
MAIVLEPGPALGLDIIQSRVPSLLKEAGGKDLAFGKMLSTGADVAKPQPIYSASLQDVLDNKLLAGARLTGWQYLILNGDTVSAAAELVFAPADPAEWQYSVLDQPPSMIVEDAIHAAETLPQFQQHEYQLRILRAPELHLYAVWLHRPDDEWLIPAAPTTSPLEPNRPYTETELTEALSPFAVSRSLPDVEVKDKQ